MHECEKCKSDNMQNLMIGTDGIFFCMSCWKPVYDEDINKEIFEKYGNKYRREFRR